jgi:hypothetical protein
MNTLEKRFWAKVKVAGADECWEWTAGQDGHGYGQMYVGYANGKAFPPEKAYRVAWRITHGDIPPHGYILHKCDNRGCVNPAHLFLGDHAANMRDAASKNRCSGTKVSLDDIRWLREWAAMGWPRRLLARAVGLSETQTNKIVQRKCRPDAPADTVPADNAISGRTKVSITDVRWIREQGAVDCSRRSLAQKIGCSQTIVNDILARRTWQNI